MSAQLNIARLKLAHHQHMINVSTLLNGIQGIDRQGNNTNNNNNLHFIIHGNIFTLHSKQSMMCTDIHVECLGYVVIMSVSM